LGLPGFATKQIHEREASEPGMSRPSSARLHGGGFPLTAFVWESKAGPRQVEWLKDGDSVLCYDRLLGNFQRQPVTVQKCTGETEWVTFSMDDGSSFEVAADHPIRTADAMKAPLGQPAPKLAADFKGDEMLLSFDSEPTQIQKLCRLKKPATYIKLFLKQHFRYAIMTSTTNFANAIAVESCDAVGDETVLSVHLTFWEVKSRFDDAIPDPIKSHSAPSSVNGAAEEEAEQSEAHLTAEQLLEVASMPAETFTDTEVASISAETFTEMASMPAETLTEMASISAETLTEMASISAETFTEMASMPAESFTEWASMPAKMFTEMASDGADSVSTRVTSGPEACTPCWRHHRFLRDKDSPMCKFGADCKYSHEDHGDFSRRFRTYNRRQRRQSLAMLRGSSSSTSSTQSTSTSSSVSSSSSYFAVNKIPEVIN